MYHTCAMVCIFFSPLFEVILFYFACNKILENVHKSLNNQTQNWIQISQLEKLLEVTPVLFSKTSSFNTNHANRINSKTQILFLFWCRHSLCVIFQKQQNNNLVVGSSKFFIEGDSHNLRLISGCFPTLSVLWKIFM